MGEFIFGKVPCLQHILLNTFRKISDVWESFFERHLILNIHTIFRLQQGQQFVYFSLASLSTNTFKFLLPGFAFSSHKGQSYFLKRKYLFVKEISVVCLSWIYKGLIPKHFDEYRLKTQWIHENEICPIQTINHSIKNLNNQLSIIS